MLTKLNIADCQSKCNKNITHNNKFVLFSVRYFFGLNFILNYEIIPNPHFRERAWGIADNSDLFSSQIYGHLCIWKSPLNFKLLGNTDCLHCIYFLNIENNIWCITLTSLSTLYNISGKKLFIHVGQSKF